MCVHVTCGVVEPVKVETADWRTTVSMGATLAEFCEREAGIVGAVPDPPLQALRAAPKIKIAAGPKPKRRLFMVKPRVKR